MITDQEKHHQHPSSLTEQSNSSTITATSKTISYLLDWFLNLHTLLPSSPLSLSATNTHDKEESKDKFSYIKDKSIKRRMIDCNQNSLNTTCKDEESECYKSARSRLSNLEPRDHSKLHDLDHLDFSNQNVTVTHGESDDLTTCQSEVESKNRGFKMVLRRCFEFCIDVITYCYLTYFVYLLWLPPSSTALGQSLGAVFHIQLDPSKEILEDEEVDKCEVSVSNVLEKSDIYLIGHVMGYAGKTILFRDCGFAWLISISWELTEMLFCCVLPNFCECWWDIVLFDVLLCNASGIVLGSYLLQWLKVALLQWNRYWDVVLYTRGQSQVREKEEVDKENLDFITDRTRHRSAVKAPLLSNVTWKQVIIQGVWCFILLFFTNTAELNSFTMKRVFGVQKNHPLNVLRLLIHAIMSYKVITNYRHYLRGSISASQLPLQFWSYLVIVVLEFAAAVHHGTLITPALIPNLVAWISMLCVGSIVYSCLATLKDSREQTYASGDDDAVKINGASRTASRTLEIHEKEC